MRKKTDSSQIS